MLFDFGSIKKHGMIVTFLFVWTCLHVVGVTYGTHNLPLHQSYIGDEQAPVNGALHILQDKSLLAVHNLKTLYYGPVFAVFALPAVVSDFTVRFVTGEVSGADDYKNFILWNWGGIVLGIRITATLVSLMTLIFVYKILSLESINEKKDMLLAFFGTTIVGLNFYFFEYSHFFKHWVFVIFFLVAQIYFALRLREVDGKRSIYWILHGICFVLSFGINYLSAIYAIAFLPLLYLLWIKKDKVARKYIYLYVGGVSFTSLLILLWHPYAFLRYLGFLNIGDVTSGGVGNTYNPVTSVDNSWGYYLTEIFFNNLPLVIGVLILLYLLYKRGVIKKQLYWLWMFISIALINMLVFCPSTHHEGRYMLPTIMMLLLLTGVALVKFINNIKNHELVIFRLVSLLLILYIGFHVVHIGKWIEIYAQGPVEKEILKEIFERQEKNEDLSTNPVLLIQSYIAGNVHTKEAYEFYIEKRGREDMNLYKAIMSAPLPDNIDLLNARYVFDQDLPQGYLEISEYEMVYQYLTPRSKELNLFDYFDENLLRLWYWKSFSPRYVRIK